MAKQQIGLLFGVQGGGKLSGESGQLILQQLNKIARSIDNTNNRMKVTIGVNEAQTRQLIQKQLNNISKGLKITIGGNASGQGAQRQVKDLTRQVDNALNKLAGMGGNADKKKYSNVAGVAKEFKSYSDAVVKAQKAYNAWQYDQSNPQLQQNLIDTVRTATNEKKRLDAALSNTTAFDKQALAYNKVIDEITKYQAKNKETLKNTPELAAKLEELNQQLAGGTFKGGNAHNRFLELTNQIRAAGGEAETLGQKIRRIFGEKLGYGIIASAAMMARQAVKEVYNNVVELDKAVVDLQIATGKNREEVKELVSTYSELGRELGATTSEVAQASDSWLRQGYSIEQVNELTRNSIMLAKLGQMESADATIALTSALRGYELQAEDVGSVTDKLVAVDMTAAVTAGQLATAMAECANSARLAGVDMNTLLGYLTQVMQTTQDAPESVGTFAKTLFARMGNIKAGKFIDDSTGEDLNDVEATLGKLGIKLRSTTNEFRDFDDVLYDIAQAWNNYSSVEQHAVATALGATRQQEKLLVLMSGYNDAIEYAETATNSAGTANQKYEAVLSSVEAAQNSFTASFEDFSQAFLDSDLVAGVIRFGDGFMQILTGITKFLSFGDGLVGQLALITAGLWALNSAMVAFNTQTGIFASTGEPIEASTYHAREYSGGDTERVNKLIVLFTREYLEKPTSLGLIA